MKAAYQNHLNGKEDIEDTVISELEQKFHRAINDDLNMPLAMSVVWGATKVSTKSKKIADLLLKFDTVLGLEIAKNLKISMQEEIPQEILELAEQRKIARQEKDWEKSDRLREEIAQKGYTIKDTKQGIEISKL